MSAQVKLGWVYEQQGRYEEAIAQFNSALALSGDEDNIIGLFGNNYALSGQKTEAMKIINKLITQSKHRYISSYWIASIYACLGENDHALKWLNKAFEERSSGLVWLKVAPKLDQLRSDPRFSELLQRIGLL